MGRLLKYLGLAHGPARSDFGWRDFSTWRSTVDEILGLGGTLTVSRNQANLSLKVRTSGLRIARVT
jgi:hypothetical protein